MLTLLIVNSPFSKYVTFPFVGEMYNGWLKVQIWQVTEMTTLQHGVGQETSSEADGRDELVALTEQLYAS